MKKQALLRKSREDCQKFNEVEDCWNCEGGLWKENFLDSVVVRDPETGSYCGQSHRKCQWEATCITVRERDGSGRIRVKKQLPPFAALQKKKKKNAKEDCLSCGSPLRHEEKFRDAAKDHCHISGEFRGVAHSACNKKLRLNVKTLKIPVVFHNLPGYDAHLIMQAMAQTDRAKELSCIAFGSLKFIDSCAFMAGSLDSLVKATLKESLKKTEELAEALNRPFKLLVKKGVYPYEYMDSFEKFAETSLPPKECFRSTLTGEGIGEKDLEHGRAVWGAFGCKNLGEYHDVYMQTDVALLTDVFENFRQICLQQYGLDPVHYYTAPGLSWDALLKKTGAELELLTDYDMHLFVEKGLRGGISMASKRYAKANNAYVPGHDETKPSRHIIYLDGNNLFGWAMCKPLPIRNFKWNKRLISEDDVGEMGPNAKKGYILEVDLEYPSELHEQHNAFPLAPEKKPVQKEWFSPYQKRLYRNLGRVPQQPKKLLLTLWSRKNAQHEHSAERKT